MVTQWVEYNILFILDRALSYYLTSPNLFVLLHRNLFKGKECLLEFGLNINWKGLFSTGGAIMSWVHSSLPIPGGNTPTFNRKGAGISLGGKSPVRNPRNGVPVTLLAEGI